MDCLNIPKGKIEKFDRITDARQYRIRPATSVHVSSYWDSGSRDTYCAYNAHMIPVALPAHAGAPQFGGKSADVQIDSNGIAYLVQFSIFRGRSMPPTIYLPVAEFERFKAELAAELPQVTDAQLYALAVTAQLKSAGRMDAWTRKYPADEWEATRAQLREIGLLRKNNAITPEGRNLARELRVY